MTSLQLSGRVAFITGGANGIGRACAERFVADGAQVVIADIFGEQALKTADEIGQSAIGVQCDVTNENSVEKAIAYAIDTFGSLDIVVASAGKGGFSPIKDQSLEMWNDIVGLCLTGVFLTIKHASRVMNNGGSIITIASLNAIQQAEGLSAYCAAKSGVVALTRVAAMELGARDIRANSILPGLVETQLTQTFWNMPGVVEEFIENAPLGRFATPRDIANVAAFLASDDSSYITGGAHSVDGGASTKRYPDIPAAIARISGVAQ